MSLYASSQRVAVNPSAFQLGVPTQALLDGYTTGAQAITDINIGSACFYVDLNGVDSTVQQTQTAGTILAGVAIRSNANAMSFAQSEFGYSSVLPQGAGISILTRGSIAVSIAVANEAGSIPLRGSIVYAMPNGTWQTQSVGGTAPATGIATNFRVRQVQSGWTVDGIVVITNQQNVGV